MQTQTQTSRELNAFFDNRNEAQAAVARLGTAGVPSQNIQMVEGQDPARTGESSGSGKKGFFEALGDFFMPDEDKHTYAEGLERGGYLVTVQTNADTYEQALDILDDEGSVDMDSRAQEWRSEGWTGQYAGATAPRAGATGAAAAIGATGADEGTIEVAEEELRVGKRDVSHGRVRVRAYTVEDQVSEDVTLESERVDIERRPVDRAVKDADTLFADQTIEVEETAQEAVVSKEARIVEEIDVHKDVERHTETISDTVRHTEVDIDDDRK